MMLKSNLTRIVVAGALLLSATFALASGGGGGGAMPSGSMPSVSTPAYDPAVEYRKGLKAFEARNFKEAGRAFDRVLRVAPKDPASNLMAGLSRSGLGEFKPARKYFERAVKYDDSLLLAHQELALTSLKLGDADAARTVLERLKARATACAGTCKQAAELAEAIHAIETALASGASATRPVSLNVATLGDHGDRAYLRAVSLINEHRYEDAIISLNRASLEFGPHPDILTYLGFASRKLGRFGPAESYYLAALKIAPDHLGATEYYGELMVQRGDIAGGKRMLAKLEKTCTFGCPQAEDLRRWIADAKPAR